MPKVDDKYGMAVRSYVFDDSLNGQWHDWSWGAVVDWHDDTHARGKKVCFSGSQRQNEPPTDVNTMDSIK